MTKSWLTRPKTSFVLTALVMVLWFPLPLRADATNETVNGIVKNIETAYEKIADLEANFTQRIVFEDFDTPFISKGKVYIKRGKMRWDYEEPSHQQIFVDGKKVLYYVPEHQQVIKTSLAAETDSHLPLNLLSGTTQLNLNFDISRMDSDEKSHLLKLIPKDPKMRTTEIQIEVSPPSYLIQKVILRETNGNQSIFTFSDLKLNKGLKDTTFSFDIPKGVEVVEPPSIR